VRAEVAGAVNWCRANGVRVIVVTGDHPDTARVVAIEMGLSQAPLVLTGDELAAAEWRPSCAASTSWLARCPRRSSRSCARSSEPASSSPSPATA
jgi:magnesium-transporting ATPase (P-type)